ncbi:MAG: UvrD-helicase domain-containing protein, partial [Acidimicrobiales bacterium]|nr:UvrD-helicase domain-containing protein [Acidimicrobiales bacterium]
MIDERQGNRVPVDQAARQLIARDGLDRTLFVEAGAGTGKTQALVGRIVELVLSDRARLTDLAAITFTEAAAAELRDRVRTRFEEARASLDAEGAAGAKKRALCEQALVDLDGAAISTLHAFAYRMLSEHPTEVGVPPRVEVLDEVQSLLEAERRWSQFLDELLSREDIEPLLLRAMHLRIRLHSRQRAGTKYSLRQIAIAFDQNWDRIVDFAAVEAPVLEPLDWEPLLDVIREVATMRSACTDEDDALAKVLLDSVEPAANRILDADQELERLRLLQSPFKRAGSKGKKENWGGDAKPYRDKISAANEAMEAFQNRAMEQVLRRLAIEV